MTEVEAPEFYGRCGAAIRAATGANRSAAKPERFGAVANRSTRVPTRRTSRRLRGGHRRPHQQDERPEDTHCHHGDSSVAPSGVRSPEPGSDGPESVRPPASGVRCPEPGVRSTTLLHWSLRQWDVTREHERQHSVRSIQPRPRVSAPSAAGRSGRANAARNTAATKPFLRVWSPSCGWRRRAAVERP